MWLLEQPPELPTLHYLPGMARMVLVSCNPKEITQLNFSLTKEHPA